MTRSDHPPLRDAARFRVRVIIAITLLVTTLSALGAYIAQRHLVGVAHLELETQVEWLMNEVDATRSVRRQLITDICESLARKPRIRASLEDDALDLLYPSARDELRSLMARSYESAEARPLEALFYRFLDRSGTLIPPPDTHAAGTLPLSEEAALSLEGRVMKLEIGYLIVPGETPLGTWVELYTFPIISSDGLEPIAALSVGFRFDRKAAEFGNGMTTGLYADGTLVMQNFEEPDIAILKSRLAEPIERQRRMDTIPNVNLAGTNYRVAARPLNPQSRYPIAHEVFLTSTAPTRSKLSAVRWRILGVASALTLLGIAVTQAMSRRLSQPMETLEVELDHTNQELERAARFSADASHQLKTPVSIMRLGLEELLNDPALPIAQRSEVESLIRQTGRLSSVIENLLLLSRLDAGRLAMDPKTENLRLLVEEHLDDLSILPDARELEIEVDISPQLTAYCDRRYASIILQNLLDNARKYNRLAGRIRISATANANAARLRIANTGVPIASAARVHIFERFHRGDSGENVPGYGLGLNLARELARLHRGSLTLLRSDAEWTEFELTLPRVNDSGVS